MEDRIKIKCLCGCNIESYSGKQFIKCLECGKEYSRTPAKLYFMGSKKEEIPADLGVVII